MDIEELRKSLETTAGNGSLMTPKHDPYNLNTTYPTFRSVLTHELAQNLESFIKAGDYCVNEYENLKCPNSPLYFEITPNPSSGFSIPSSGVTANSIMGSSLLDRLVAVSGATQGRHVFGEDSSLIQRKVNIGDLKFKQRLK